MAGDPGYIRWTPDEWLKVAVCALPHLDKGMTMGIPLLKKAQWAALHSSRRREDDALRKLAWKGAAQTRKYIEQARALTPEQRAEIAPPPEPRKPAAPRGKIDEGRDYSKPGTNVKWTTLEKARVARQVEAFKALGDKRVLGRLIIEAQELVIEPDRRRPVNSIRQGGTYNDRMIEEGHANAWLLDELDEQKKAEAEDAIELVTARSAESAAAPAAALPTPAASGAFSDSARAFGDTVMAAFDRLLTAHTESILREVYGKFSAMASTTSAQIAAQIEQGMRATVHRIVEAELGGPITTPSEAAALPGKPTELEEAAPRAQVLKLDVVGLKDGQVQQQVRAAFNGNTDLRFVDPDTKNGYAPHRGRHCIMLTQRVPHMLKHKIKAAGIEPIYVRPTAGHIIHAIEALCQAEGVPYAQH